MNKIFKKINPFKSIKASKEEIKFIELINSMVKEVYNAVNESDYKEALSILDKESFIIEKYMIHCKNNGLDISTAENFMDDVNQITDLINLRISSHEKETNLMDQFQKNMKDAYRETAKEIGTDSFFDRNMSNAMLEAVIAINTKKERNGDE